MVTSNTHTQSRLVFGVVPSGVTLVVALVVFVQSPWLYTEPPTVLQQTVAEKILSAGDQVHASQAAAFRSATLLEEHSCQVPSRDDLVLKHSSSWDSSYSFVAGKGNPDQSMGRLLMSGNDLVWENGTIVVCSTLPIQREMHSSPVLGESAQAQVSLSVWQVRDCRGRLLAAITATHHHTCRLVVFNYSVCEWERSSFSVDNDAGELVGNLSLVRHNEFGALQLTDAAGAGIATLHAIAKRLSSIEAKLGNKTDTSIPTDARVLSALMIKVHQTVVTVVNRLSVNSVATPILGFCAFYLLFSACAFCCCGGSDRRLSGPLIANVAVVVVIAVGTATTLVWINPTV